MCAAVFSHKNISKVVFYESFRSQNVSFLELNDDNNGAGDNNGELNQATFFFLKSFKKGISKTTVHCSQ